MHHHRAPCIAKKKKIINRQGAREHHRRAPGSREPGRQGHHRKAARAQAARVQHPQRREPGRRDTATAWRRSHGGGAIGSNPQKNLICQLLGDEKLEWRTIRECFSRFSKKIRMKSEIGNWSISDTSQYFLLKTYYLPTTQIVRGWKKVNLQ